jgi:hypothetical protein
MTIEHKKQTALAGFVERYKGRLIGSLVGGIAIACVAQVLSPSDTALADAASTREQWQVSEKLDEILSSRTPEETFVASGAAIIEVGDLDDIREAISDKRSRLENAAKELENLEEMIAKAEGLNVSDREEAIASALIIYNDSLSGAEFEVGVDLTSERAQNAWNSAKSSKDLLLSLHPMQQ